jgi:hypothetical protein
MRFVGLMTMMIFAAVCPSEVIVVARDNNSDFTSEKVQQEDESLRICSPRNFKLDHSRMAFCHAGQLSAAARRARWGS